MGEGSQWVVWGVGAIENAGCENDGPSKSRGVKMQDVKMMDQVAGHENDGPLKSQ